MQIVHSKTVLNRPSRILCSRKSKFHAKNQNSALKNIHSALRKCNGTLTRLPRILRSKNGNSALRKWKSVLKNGIPALRKWKFYPVPWKVSFSIIFRTKSGNSALPRTS